MVAELKTGTPLPTILREVTEAVASNGHGGFSDRSKQQFFDIIAKVPMAYQKVNAIFSSPERKSPGTGGVFSIFVSDLCKGCAACVTACGDHMALRMVAETEEGRFGFVVDEVLGDHQTVIKNLGRFYRHVDMVSGATILGNGTVALILDPQRMVRDAIENGSHKSAGTGTRSHRRKRAQGAAV